MTLISDAAPHAAPPPNAAPAALEGAVTRIGVHEHLCLIYENTEQQFRAIVPFVRAGLERGERCLYVADEHTTEAVLAALEAGGIDVDAALRSGSLVVAGGGETYLLRGSFDPRGMIAFLEQAVEEATANGFSALRITGEMTWALAGAVRSDHLVEYETALEAFFAEHDALAICQYSHARFSPAILTEVIRTHPAVIYGDRVCQNLYHVPASELVSEDREALEVQRLLSNIYEREQVEADLRESEERLAAELAATTRLQEASTQFIGEGDLQAVYEGILDAAVAIMRSDFASLQVLHPERGEGGELQLLAFRGFSPEAASFWEWVRPASGSTCGMALKTGERVVASDVQAAEFMAGTEDLDTYLQTGIRAVQTTPLFSRSGRMLGMVSTHWREVHEPTERDLRLFDVLVRQAADLIERSRAEEALRASEERYRDLLESTDIAIYTTDAQGIITMFNDAAARLWGREPEIGVDQWCGSWKLFWPDGSPMEHEECPMGKTLKENRPVRGAEAIAERPDGSRFWFMPYPTPFQDAAGNLVGAVNVLVDITERKEAELAVRESERRYRQLVEGIGVAVYTTDEQGHITLYNEAAVALWGREPTLGVDRWCGSLRMYEADGSLLPLDQCPMAIALKEDRSFHGDEAMIERPDGSRIWVAVYPTPLHDASGRLLGAVNVFIDVSERKQAEHDQVEARRAAEEAQAAAEAAARARDEFLSIASHELRNPVAALHGTAQLLRRARDSGRLTEDRLTVYLENLEASSRHLSTLTEDLLDVSRLQRGALPIRPQLSDVARLVRDCVRNTERGSHRFTVEVDGEHLEAEIDVDRVRQVVNNLLSNAVKYSPEEGEVCLRLRGEGDGICLEVEDSGIGLPRDTLESIFQPFGRAPNAVSANVPGLGLGLYVSRRIAEQHGGRLWAQSDGEGQGTTMSLWLPTRVAAE